MAAQTAFGPSDGGKADGGSHWRTAVLLFRFISFPLLTFSTPSVSQVEGWAEGHIPGLQPADPCTCLLFRCSTRHLWHLWLHLRRTPADPWGPLQSNYLKRAVNSGPTLTKNGTSVSHGHCYLQDACLRGFIAE